MVLSALAARTRRVKLGPHAWLALACAIPIIFAAQWATLGMLSGGGGACLPSALEVPLAQGVVQARSRSSFGQWASLSKNELAGWRGIAILRRLWSEDRVTFKGRYYRFQNVSIDPKPVQKPMPIWIASSPNPELIGEKRFRRALARVARLARRVDDGPNFARRVPTALDADL